MSYDPSTPEAHAAFRVRWREGMAEILRECEPTKTAEEIAAIVAEFEASMDAHIATFQKDTRA